LFCGCGQEGDNGREVLKKSEKVERVADGRAAPKHTLLEYLVEYLSLHHVTACQSFE
jgi:hypothetical protein